MATYIVVHVDFADPAALRPYQELASPTMGQYGIRALGKALDPQVLEGTAPGKLTVVLEAASADAAERWFHSVEYQRAADARRTVAEFTAVIVPGTT